MAELEMADRFTICNMAIEAGAKNGIFPVDEKTKAYLKGRVDRDWQGVEADADANYVREIKIELDKLVPVVAYPHLPETRTRQQKAAILKSTRLLWAAAPTDALKIWRRLRKC